MRTEAWIVLCAMFSVAAFFCGVLYGEATARPILDGATDRARELELVIDSMERREAEWRSARKRGVEPNLPPKHIPAGGRVIRE